MTRPSCKERILQAADAVAREGGASKLTLDAVAERAEVSKGGVLYHFPTKEALLVGMVASHIEQAQHRRCELEQECTGAEGALKADVLATLQRDPDDNKVSAALLAAVANEPKLLEPCRAFHQARFERLAGKDASEAFAKRALLPLAADGLFFLELLQVSPFTPEQRQALVDTLLKLTDEAVALPPEDVHTA
jgi:AcrR family transcriptional regulator